MRVNNQAILFYTLFMIILAGMYSCNKPGEAEPSSAEEAALFELLSPVQTNIDFNANGQLLYPGDETGLYSNISGTAVGDINNDGLPDLFFSGGRGNSSLYLNKGDFKFEDITATSGIRDAGLNNADNQGVNFVDINGDGWLDIYILKTGLTGNFKQQKFNSDGANLLYINQRDNTFKEAAKAYGLDIIGLSHTANFFDYDADGDLDLYMVQTGEPGAAFSFAYYEAPPRSKWLNDQFLENRNGQFVDVREQAGLPALRSIGLSVAVGDVNNDGFSDIYVANDFFGPDFFYLNNGDRTFSDKRTAFFTKTPMSAMGSDFADINNDGWLDLFVGEMMPASHKRQKLNLVPFSIEIYNKLSGQGEAQYARNMLQINNQGQGFSDIGLLSGVFATEWSWSSFFFDADNDGYKDLFIANGILRDMTNMDFVKDNFGDDYTSMAEPEAKAKANPTQAPSVRTRNFIFHNKDGYQFEDNSELWGLSQAVHSRGATYADLDADGDLDLIVNNIKDSPYIYKNLANNSKGHNYLRLRLSAKGKNTYGIGARAALTYDGKKQYNYLSTQRGFQSCPEPILHFGLEKAKNVDTLIVTWPGGQQEAWFNIAANQLLEIKQGSGSPYSPPAAQPGILRPVNDKANNIHQEGAHSDYKAQRLLIREYHQEGPGIAVADANGDGLDDFYVGGAAPKPGQLFLQQKDGAFQSDRQPIWSQLASKEDMGAVFFDANGDEQPDLYLASGSSEFGPKDATLADQLLLNDGTGRFADATSRLPKLLNSSSVVVACDYDGDGDKDIFVGSRITTGNYSAIPGSALLRNEDGQYREVSQDVAPGLQEAGRVTAALWSDADNDGDPDLIICGEWMPITIFYQEDGRFRKAALAGTSGWWNSIIGSDVDNDGDIDYIAGNHGLNSIFKASEQEPVSLITGDFDGNGQQDPLVFKYTDGINAPFVNRDIFTSQMPSFNNRYYSFAQYAQVNKENFFDEGMLSKAVVTAVNELRSCVFINDGQHQFTKKPLPVQAQMAPLYGVLAEDFDADGFVDLLISGNTYNSHYEYGNIDALHGLMLMGDGTGHFQALPKAQSGFWVSHAGRSMAMLFHEASNTPYIIASNNDGPLEIFEWPVAVEAIDIPAGSTHAMLTLSDGSQRKQEHYMGGGYLSQSCRRIFKTRAITQVQFYKNGQPH
jgi:hypothetical protein